LENKEDGILDKDRTMDNVQKYNICIMLRGISFNRLENESYDKVCVKNIQLPKSRIDSTFA
jgi:hypothetical protein